MKYKILRTVLIALAVLISIFFVVFANIQTNLGKEQEQARYEMERKAMEQLQRTEQELMKVMEELAECRGEQN